MNSPELPQEALLQMDLICSLPSHPDVKHLRALSKHRKEKAIRFEGHVYIVQYFHSNRRENRVKVLSEVPADTNVFPVTKRLYHKAHTKQRLKERFNIEASDKDLKTISNMCSTRYGHVTIQKMDGQSKNYIRFQGLDIVVVYAEKSDSLITAMPTSFLSDQEKDFLFNKKRVRYKQVIEHSDSKGLQ